MIAREPVDALDQAEKSDGNASLACTGPPNNAYFLAWSDTHRATRQRSHANLALTFP